MPISRIRRLALTHFRNYRAASLETRGDVVVLVGPNGAGKTNAIEAISFLSPGRGLRRATLEDVADNQGDGSWAVSAEVEGALGLATLGTGIDAPGNEAASTSRRCRIDREPVSSATSFGDHLRMVWLTPAMDGLFLGAAAGRTLDGRHLTDLQVIYAPKGMPARDASTGEQKALLIGLVLAHATLVAEMTGIVPLLLLDEVVAHLDPNRRKALFEELAKLGAQVWMTGADPATFTDIGPSGEIFDVESGQVSRRGP